MPFQCSRDDVADNMRKKIEDAKAVHIGNPKTLEFQVGLILTLEVDRILKLVVLFFSKKK